MTLEIINKGQEIKTTNYYSTPYKKFSFLSFNEGAFRMLIGDELRYEIVREFRIANHISFALDDKQMIMILEDDTSNPYCVQFLNALMDDERPTQESEEITFIAYMQDGTSIKEVFRSIASLKIISP